MNNLERHVLRLIGENLDNPDVFTDTAEGLEPIRDSLNDAIEELAMVIGYYRRRYLLVLHEERAIYRLDPQNDDLGWVIGVWDRENKRAFEQSDIWAIAAMDPWFIKRNGTPEWFYQMGWKYLGVYPRPGSKGRILELDCIMIPKPYAHEMKPIRIKEQWERAAVFRACSDFFASRGDAKRAGEFLTQYLETAQLMALHPETAERQFQMGGGFRREVQKSWA